jgi:glyoxylase-like metal-dependent hydrolase (beta-lactamase superfamily II)
MKPAFSHLVALLAPGLVSLSSTASGQQEMNNVEITTEPVAKGIYMLQGRGGNIGLSVGTDGAFLVDDQFAPLTDKIQEAVSRVTDESVRFVLNTHWHGDHTGGNENFGKAGAMIVAHENVRKRLDPAEFKELMGRSQQAPPDALPVITFTEVVTFHWNAETIRVFHVAHAHTDGDAIVDFQDANVVHMGDVFFNGRYPFIDVESGGSVHGVIDAAEQVLALVDANTRIIPGHGALAGRDELRAYRDMLVTVRDRVAEMAAREMTEDQVVAAQPTKDLDAMWGERAERFVRAVFRGVKGR